MKEETKKKVCKISKIVGFAITFGFAVFGVLCAAMLMANGSGAKDDIKTLDSSLVQNEVRSERNIKPRKADGEPVNLLEGAPRERVKMTADFIGGAYAVYFQYTPSDNTYYTGWVSLPAGTYMFKPSPNNAPGWGSGACIKANNSSIQNGCSTALDFPGEKCYIPSSEASFLFYSNNSKIFEWSSEDASSMQFGFSAFLGYFPELYLLDTMELPVSSSITFPESFSPLGLFGDSVTNNGGYVYLPNASGNELDIEITGLIFKYGGVVYDGIHIECVRALSMGYINDDGQLVKQGGANDYMWSLSWIKFYQRYNGQSPQNGIVVVMAELKSVTDNANDMPVAFTGRTQWVNRSDRTIQIIDDLGTITGRYDGRYSDMTDKKLLEWVSSSFSVGNSLGVMGNNSVFDIFTNAFDSVIPILSIAILPNITLGMLLFIPLIGAIIVIIIRVVKK